MKWQSCNGKSIGWLVPLIVLLGAPGVAAQRYTAADIVYIPAPMYGYVYPGAQVSACFPFCGVVVRNRILERRQQRFDALRADAPAATQSFGPITLTKPAVPGPGSDEELLPAYRSAGKVRPEYDGSGKYTGPYAELEPGTTNPPEASPVTASEVRPVSQAPQPKRRAQPMLPCPKAAQEC